MKLTAFRIVNGGRSGEQLPTRLKLLSWGDNESVKGHSVRVTDRTVAELPARQELRGFNTVALDYEHNTLDGSAEFKRTQEPRKIAAHLIPEIVPGEGLFVNVECYTPSGIDNAREYIDLSPVVELDKKTNEVLFLHSVALCRQGAINDLHFYNVTLNPEDTSMLPEEFKKMIEDLTKQLASLAARVDELTKTTTPNPVEALSATVQGLETKLTSLSVDWASSEAKREKATIIDLAIRDGKVVALTPDAVSKISVSDLQAYIAAITPTVPLNRQTPPAVAVAGAGHGTLLEQYNAIIDPAEKAVFFRENRIKMFS